MPKRDRVFEKIMRGTSDANVKFDELRGALLRAGFGERVRGDHHIFAKDGVEEILNIQPKGDMAKPYQVKQVRGVFLRHKLGEADA